MNEDTTQNLPCSSSFEERVLAEFTSIRQEFAAQREFNAQQHEFNAQLLAMVQQLNARLSALEEKVDARFHDTRPIWEDVRARLKEIEHTLGAMNSHMRTLVNDSFKLRACVEKLEDEKFENSSL